MTTVPKRSEVPVAYTWNAYSVFPSDEAWVSAMTSLERDLESAGRVEGRLAENPAILADALNAVEQAGRLAHKIYVYAMMFEAVDTADQDAAAKLGRARSLFGKTQATISLSDPNSLLSVLIPSNNGQPKSHAWPTWGNISIS